MANRDEEIYLDVVKLISSRHPTFKIVSKQSSSFMKFLNFFSRIFNPSFMTRYITTVGTTVYVPESDMANPSSLWRVLVHECMHMEQANRDGKFLHAIKYFFPQVLVVFSLFAVLAIWFSNWWLLSLVFLVSLAPLPAYWRTLKEGEGYDMSMWIDILEHNWNSNIADTITAEFTGPAYYFMWPFHSHVLRRTISVASVMQRHDILPKLKYNVDPVFKEIKAIIEGHKT